MLLEGSCHRGAVRFRVESEAPYQARYHGEGEKHFPGFPEESLAEWHRRYALESL